MDEIFLTLQLAAAGIVVAMVSQMVGMILGVFLGLFLLQPLFRRTPSEARPSRLRKIFLFGAFCTAFGGLLLPVSWWVDLDVSVVATRFAIVCASGSTFAAIALGM